MKLLHDLVAIEPDKPEEKTKSGLYVAEQIKTYPPTGTVVALAPGVEGVKVGDKVQYAVYASVDLEADLAVVPFEYVLRVLDAKSH